MNCHEFEQYLDDIIDHGREHELSKEYFHHLDVCSDCRHLYQEYTTVIKNLRALDIVECPDEVLDKVYEKIAVQEQPKQTSFLSIMTHYLWPRKMSLAGGLAVIVIMVFTFFPSLILWNGPEKSPTYSEAEIKLADQQVKQALACLHKVTRKTHDMLEKEILINQVTKPFYQTVKEALQPLMNGDVS